jgi:hypothetical protein
LLLDFRGNQLQFRAMLYHGSPKVIDRLERAEAALLAVYGTPCLRMAACYAGAGGHVYSFTLSDEARVLDATGDWRSGPWHYPTGEEWAKLQALLAAEKIAVSEMDCIKPGSLGPALLDGIPSWEAIIYDGYDIVPELTGALLDLGYDVVLDRVSYEAVANDATGRHKPAPGTAFGRHVELVRARGKATEVQAAVLDPFCIDADSLRRHPVADAFGQSPRLPNLDLGKLLRRHAGTDPTEEAETTGASPAAR